ncbi:helix-turn-helix domain-containing protein [Streptococcus dentiloxodontae]
MTYYLSDQEFKHEINFDNALLPFKLDEIKVEQGRPDILFHWHPEMEVQYVYEGTARYHIDYDYFDSTAGDIYLIRPNGMHSVHPLGKEPHHTDTLLFHLDMLGQSTIDQTSLRYLQPLQNSNYKFVQRIQPGDEGYKDIKNSLMEIFKLIRNQGRHFELLLKSKLFDFLYLLYYHHKVERKLTDDLYRKNERIRELIDYIHKHYAEVLSIDKLAELMGYSKTHFMTVFKQHTGTSCTEFIIQARLNAACEELQNTIKPILEIATDVGFNNLSNFNRQFKRYYNMTPSQYRKTHSNKRR